VWGVLGAAGVVVCGYMGVGKWKRLLPALALPVLVAGAGNYLYHQTIAHQHAAVSSLYGYVKTHYTTADCIGFTPDPDSNERFNLYSYYLHGYDIKKMTVRQWQQQDCRGPYLTYDTALATRPGLQVAAVEAGTNLLMITHAGSTVATVSSPTSAVWSPAELPHSAILFK